MPIRCPICLAPAVQKSKLSELASLPCGHVFHEECVLDWLDRSTICPKCRVIVPSRQSVTKLFLDLVDAPGSDLLGGGDCGVVGSLAGLVELSEELEEHLLSLPQYTAALEQSLPDILMGTRTVIHQLVANNDALIKTERELYCEVKEMVDRLKAEMATLE